MDHLSELAKNPDHLQYNVEALTYGMYVVALDVPWGETRFMFEGFLIEEEVQLAELRKYKFAIVSKRRSRSGLFAPETKAKLGNSKSTRPKVAPTQTDTKLEPQAKAAAAAPAATPAPQAKPNVEAPARSTPAPQAQKPVQAPQVKVNPGSAMPPKGDLLSTIASPFMHLKDNLSDMFSRKPTIAQNYNPQAVDRSDPNVIQAELKRLKDAHRIRGQFVNDDADVASKKVVHYMDTASVNHEIRRAHMINEELQDAINFSFADDLNEVQLDIAVNITTEAIEQVVDSVARNPDALQLVSKIKSLDQQSYKHAMEVSLLLVSLGRELCLPKTDLVEIGLGGLLHDVGEIRPPKEMSNLPRLRYITKFKLYRDEHIKTGLEIAEKAKYSTIVKNMIAHHHEYYNGSGYPGGKKKNQIGLYANMLVVIDNYVSMTSGRSCEKPATPSKALGYLYNNKEILFHPEIVDKFIQMVGLYPVGTKVKLSTGDVGFVIKQSRTRKLLPIVMVVLDKKGKKLDTPIHINLTAWQEEGRKPIKIASELPADAYGVYAEDYFNVSY